MVLQRSASSPTVFKIIITEGKKKPRNLCGFWISCLVQQTEPNTNQKCLLP